LYYGLALISVIMTFNKYSLTEVISLLNLPAYEQSNMISVFSILLNFNLTALFGSLLVIYSLNYYLFQEILPLYVEIIKINKVTNFS
jgi:hypothetical protein